MIGELIIRLSGGENRWTGRADAVAREAMRKPAIVNILVSLLEHDDPRVRGRASYALEKISRHREMAHLLAPQTPFLIACLETSRQNDLRWHLVRILPRLGMKARQKAKLVPLLLDLFRGARSRILRTLALQALAGLAEEDSLLEEILPALLVGAQKSCVPALKARARLISEARRKKKPERPKRQSAAGGRRCSGPRSSVP